PPPGPRPERYRRTGEAGSRTPVAGPGRTGRAAAPRRPPRCPPGRSHPYRRPGGPASDGPGRNFSAAEESARGRAGAGGRVRAVVEAVEVDVGRRRRGQRPPVAVDQLELLR